MSSKTLTCLQALRSEYAKKNKHKERAPVENETWRNHTAISSTHSKSARKRTRSEAMTGGQMSWNSQRGHPQTLLTNIKCPLSWVRLLAVPIFPVRELTERILLLSENKLHNTLEQNWQKTRQEKNDKDSSVNQSATDDQQRSQIFAIKSPERTMAMKK